MVFKKYSFGTIYNNLCQNSPNTHLNKISGGKNTFYIEIVTKKTNNYYI